MKKRVRHPSYGIPARLLEIRLRVTGPRGGSAFARRLGLSPSTYRAYESDRVCPTRVLLHIHQVTGVDLRWLLTGQFPPASGAFERRALSARNIAIIQRFSHRLNRRDSSYDAVTAMIDLLEDVDELERITSTVPQVKFDRVLTSPPIHIPILGRTAADVPQFWGEHDAKQRWPVPKLERQDSRTLTHLTDVSGGPWSGRSVQLVQCSTPTDLMGLSVTEFIALSSAIRPAPNAFALRIDGDSMAPMLQHGDIVVVSPDRPARPGRPAVVKLQQLIGLTCKLYHPTAHRIRLIPINREFPTTTHTASRVEWAFEVLFRIQLETNRD